MSDQQQQQQQEVLNRVKHKLVFLGNQFVGKTSIIERYMYNIFDDKTQPTVGIDFLAKTVKLDDRQLRLLLWDTAGQEKFHSLIPSYLRDASCAIIVFDVTNLKSFEGADNWYKQVKNARGNEALLVLLANKCDQQRAITMEEGQNYAKSHDMLYFEVSAKSGEGIESSFEQICLALPMDTSFVVTQNIFQQQINRNSIQSIPIENSRQPIRIRQIIKIQYI